MEMGWVEILKSVAATDRQTMPVVCKNSPHLAQSAMLQSKADMSQLNLPHGTNSYKVENRKTKKYFF